MSEWKIEFYQSADGQSPAKDWFDEQEAKVKARLGRIFDLLQEQGTSVGEPHVKHVEDKLYEIRAEQNTNTYRVIYFAYTGKRFILLHGFQKKSPKLPKRELELAKQRMKELVNQEKNQQEKASSPEGNKSKKGKKR
ncbi:type II toxin-antitoxin system RelE/ParE family toxin [Nostoc sp. NZL]|uniref:type II toxin-antitoxin system RelE/ParE family toxin n=1 Tax=Nostoc sp. NZL TaxID=2650612 RepID=UPI0018C55060|nr:type II toxin-antitoxin system RelE/ParE family toxin [Nostoc sp. NZL]